MTESYGSGSQLGLVEGFCVCGGDLARYNPVHSSLYVSVCAFYTKIEKKKGFYFNAIKNAAFCECACVYAGLFFSMKS